MREINLLPEIFKIKGSVARLSKTLKKVAAVVFIVLVASVSISIGSFVVFSNKLDDVTSRQNQLKTQIKALEETEQRLVLVKDRLEKVTKVYAKETPLEEIATFEDIYNRIPEGVSIQTASLSTGDVTIAVSADSTSAFNNVLDMLVGSKLFSRIEMSSFSYTPGAGYQIGLLLIRGQTT